MVDSPAGVRTYPYSTDPYVNPLRYSSIASLQEIHGEPVLSNCDSYFYVRPLHSYWRSLGQRVHNVYAPLVEEHGWSSTAMEDPTGANIVYLHLFMDALSLQPCNPTRESFISLLLIT